MRNRISVAGIAGLLIIAAVGGGLWYWATNKNEIIRSKLEDTVEKKSGGLYRVNYDSLQLDEVNGHLLVSAFTLTYDSLKYEQLKTEQKEPFLLFNISIPQLNITGVQTPRALVDKEISGRRMSIVNPLIEILYTNSGKNSRRSIPDKEIYEQILGGLKLIKLDSLVITGATITTRNLKSSKTFVRFTNFSLSLVDLAIDSVTGADTDRLLFAKQVNVDCEKFSWASNNRLYHYAVESISFRSADSLVKMKSFFMTPALGENEFSKKFTHQVDRMDISLHDIEFRNADFYQLANEIISADMLSVGSAHFRIYRDRNKPEDTRSKVGNYPHQLISKIPVEFAIKKAIIRNADIEYKERSTVTHQAGVVRFGASSALISNITNRKALIARDKRMVVSLRSLFLDKVPLYSRWTFELGQSNGRFAVSGKGDEADAVVFNSLSVPMGPVEFKSGRIQRMEFNFAGDDYNMKGTVQLLYNKFRITLLKKDEDSVHFEKRKMASLFANVKIEDSNPDDNEPLRVANVNLPRDRHRSMFNLVWKGLFEGVKDITNAKK